MVLGLAFVGLMEVEAAVEMEGLVLSWILEGFIGCALTYRSVLGENFGSTGLLGASWAAVSPLGPNQRAVVGSIEGSAGGAVDVLEVWVMLLVTMTGVSCS